MAQRGLVKYGNKVYLPGKITPAPKGVLITGHLGMIGRNLWDELEGYKSTLIRHGFDLPDNNIISLDEVIRASIGKKIVVHLAAEPDVRASIADPFGTFNTNVKGTMNVLRACMENRIERVIIASSSLAEECKSPYAASKISCESYFRAFYESYGMCCIILRISNTYGKYSMHKTNLIPKVIRSAILGNSINIINGGSQVCDFIYARDVANAIVKTILAPAESVAGKTISIGTSNLTSVRKVIDIIIEIHGESVSIREKDDDLIKSKNEPLPDVKTAKSLLNFKAYTSLRTGIEATYSWIQKEISDNDGLYKI